MLATSLAFLTICASKLSSSSDGIKWMTDSRRSLSKNSWTFSWKFDSSVPLWVALSNFMIGLPVGQVSFIFFSMGEVRKENSMHMAPWSLCAPSNFHLMFVV